MKKYEAVFILDIRKVEDEGKGFTEEFGKNLESWGGKLLEANAMGRKQFAREINKRKAGIYWDYVFELDPLKVIQMFRPFPAPRWRTDTKQGSRQRRIDQWHPSTKFFLWAI